MHTSFIDLIKRALDIEEINARTKVIDANAKLLREKNKN
jgi:hypothetical protein